MGKSQAADDGKHDAVYLRVSGRGQDTASQEPDLKRWAESQDGPVVWYRDKFKDGLDLSTPAGCLMANVLASVAAYETEVRSERVRAGQEVARAAGKHMGRPAGIRTPVKVTREQDTLVRRMKTEGEPIASIARATGLSRVTIYRVLDRPAAAAK